MSNVLITGSAGFVGSHVVDYFLTNTDHNIIGLDRLDFSGNLNRLAELESVRTARKRFRQIHHDLRAPVNPLLAKQIGKVEWILHLAAASHVDRSITDPMSFVLDNVVGTCNALLFAKEVGAKYFQMSTDEVFGPARGDECFKELDRYKSGNPYAATKAGAEELCVAFHNTYKMHIVIGHGMNIVSTMQHPEKMVPSTIRKVLAGETVLIHADTTCKIPGSRYYIDAIEVARAIEFIMVNGPSGEKFNICGEREITNLELVHRISDVLKKLPHYELVSWHESRPGHDLVYRMSSAKLTAMGFKRKLFFEQSIENTVKWTVEHPHWLHT